MKILLVTGIEGVRNCANALESQLGMTVDVAQGWRSAVASLRKSEYAAVVVDDTLAECDPTAAEAIWSHAGLSIPIQVNFALSGIARVLREIRAALHRRDREQLQARRAAAAELETEVKAALAGLLLHSQLAMAGPEVPPSVADKLRLVADLAVSLRQRLIEIPREQATQASL